MAIEGYATATSVIPGGEIGFCLSSDPPGSVTCTVSRVGKVPVATSFAATLSTQPLPAADAWAGFGWPVAQTFTVPLGWPAGLYQVAGQGGEVALQFVVRPSQPGSTSRTLLQVCFITPQAYSNEGGKSLYFYNSAPDFNETSRASIVSLDRRNGLPGYEPALIQWLEAEGAAVEYCSDVDFDANPGLLSGYDCLILAGHDEYWTKAKRDQLEQFVAAGGNLVVLSGNTGYRQVRLQNGNRQMVFYKYAGNDPVQDPQTTTVAWAEPPVNRPPNILLGAGWTAGAFGGAASAYAIRFPNHWVFNGAPFSTQPPTTSAFITYETDAAAFVEEDEGYPRVTGEEGTPLSFVVLASADLRSWGGADHKPGFATMGIYHRCGTVFNAAAAEWTAQLGGDPVVAQITRNVLGRLGQRVPADWEDIGHANFGTALTALDGRLFIATSENLLWRRFPVEAEVVWRQIGQANGVTALAGGYDTLFCVTSDNVLWWRPPVEENVNWTPIGNGPPAGTRALAATRGMLYAVDAAGALHRAPAVRQAPTWQPVPYFTNTDATVNAMTAWGDILFASTTGNRLLRSDRDWIDESGGWADIHPCNFSIGLAVVDGMLFVATSENRLWRLDLHGLRQP